MNDLQIFNCGVNQLRTVERENELWWVLKDVCSALNISDHITVAKRLDVDEVGQTHVIDGKGRMQPTYIINEPGLYNVILRSDKPEAKDFKRWVTHEVIPTIRNKGAYSLQSPMTPAQLLAAQAQLLVEMEKKVEAVESHTLALEEKVDNAVKVFSRPAQDHWKSDMDEAIKDLCKTNHLSVPATKGRMYDQLERSVGCSINSRLTRMRHRKKKAGMRHKDAMALTKLDAIAADKQLRAIFEGIVREWRAKGMEGDSVCVQ